MNTEQQEDQESQDSHAEYLKILVICSLGQLKGDCSAMQRLIERDSIEVRLGSYLAEANQHLKDAWDAYGSLRAHLTAAITDTKKKGAC